MKRNLAVYKKDGSPWIREELIEIAKACGSDYYELAKMSPLNSRAAKLKYIWDQGSNDRFMHMWSRQDTSGIPNTHTFITYETLVHGIKFKRYKMR